MPAAEWPDPVNRALKHVNTDIYIPMQGPSELGASGKIEKWDRVADLPKLTVPILSVGAEYNTMDPKHMEMIAKTVRNGRYLYCPKGSHLALYDDQETWMTEAISDGKYRTEDAKMIGMTPAWFTFSGM